VSETMMVTVAQRGGVTLPKSLRERYKLQAGDGLTLLDIGGVFVLSLRRSEVDALADRLAQALIEKGESLESTLQALREERERYAGQNSGVS